MAQIDSLPYKTYQRIKGKYTDKMIVLTESDMTRSMAHQVFADHREYIEYMFGKIGIRIKRHNHDYKSLDGKHPQLGLIYLANDSDIMPGLEVHCLIGHNAEYMAEAIKEIT